MSKRPAQKFLARSVIILLASASIAACESRSADPFNSKDPAQREAHALGLQPKQVDPAALKAQVKDPQARRFYEARDWQPAWDDATAGGLIAALGDSERHALSKGTFLKFPASGPAAAKEAALTTAALAYASALAKGSIDPKSLFEVYTVPRPNPDLAGGLAAAVGNKTVAQWFASLPPQTAEYKALSDAYVHYLKLAAQQGSSGIADGKPLEVGKSDPRVPQLAEALQGNGYMQATPAKDPNLYTPAMAEAVKRLQKDYGIDPDGVVGPDTLQVLNSSAQDKARQLAVNLERRRWLERTPPATRIDVNTAAAFLDYWRGGQLANHRNVIVGQPDWETPELQAPIFQLVANPSWNVPESIEEKEIGPKGAGYMAKNHMVRKAGRIVQLPGPDNSLGQVKFDMRDDQAIYLHDTPAKTLFTENERHLSHGCVRVDKAIDFARMLAGDDGILPKFDEELPSGDETFVKMKTEVPVRLMYHTVFVEDGGRIGFRADPYGWDDRVAAALGMAQRNSLRFRTHIRDFGP